MASAVGHNAPCFYSFLGSSSPKSEFVPEQLAGPRDSFVMLSPCSGLLSAVTPGCMSRHLTTIWLAFGGCTQLTLDSVLNRGRTIRLCLRSKLAIRNLQLANCYDLSQGVPKIVCCFGNSLSTEQLQPGSSVSLETPLDRFTSISDLASLLVAFPSFVY